MLLMTSERSQSAQVSLTPQKCPVELQNYLGWDRLFPSPCTESGKDVNVQKVPGRVGKTCNAEEEIMFSAASVAHTIN